MEPLRIALDLTALLPQHSGVDNYLKELVLHLGSLDFHNRYTLFLNHADRNLFLGRLPRNFDLRAWCPRPRPARLVFQQAGLPAACAALDIEVLHSPSFLMPYWRGRTQHLVTVHDMTIFTMPEVHSRLHRSAAFRRAVRTSILRAGLVNVPSEATRQALLERLPAMAPEKVRVTPLGCGSEFQPAAPQEIRQARERLSLPERYILYVGTMEPRKNLELLVECYRGLTAAWQVQEHLILAGRLGWGYASLLERLRAPELRSRVRLLGFVPPEDLPWLYRGARLFVYPSLHEGFGFCPLEAMACGVPVVSALGSSLEENLHGAAELVPPRDPEALSAALLRMLRDEDLRRRRVEAGFRRAAAFRWEKTARAVFECYQELAGRPGLALVNAPRAFARPAQEAGQGSGGTAVYEDGDQR
jgi:glycosyltransferase involved in cell wall biosynthesis